MRKLKIAYMSDATLPSKTANSIHVMRMCGAWARQGHNVTLYGLTPKKETERIWEWYGETKFNLILHRFKIPKLTLPVHALLSSFKVIKDKPDVIFGRSHLTLFILALFGRNVTYELHSPVNNYSGLRKFAIRKLLHSHRLVKLVLISQQLSKIIQRENPTLNKEKILVLHDGANVSQLNRMESKSKLLDGEMCVGYIGTVSEGRGVELIYSLAKKNSNHEFHIVGGNIKDLEKLGIQKRSIPKNLILHGFVSTDEAVILRDKCHILLAPYQRRVLIRSGNNTSDYMSPLKIFEYMAAGKAIIASDLKVIKEVLTNEVNALLVEPDNQEEWNLAINRLTNDHKLRENLGNKAKEDIVNRFAWSIRVTKILKEITN